MARGLRFTGAAAVVVLWTTLPVAARLARFDLLGVHPLSYLGTQPRSAPLFAAGLAVAALLLTAFHRFVRGRYAVGRGFSAAMLTGLAGQGIAAFVPIAGQGAAHRIHTAGALVLGASLPLLMWRFAAAQPAGPWRRRAYRLFWAEAAACAGGFGLSVLTLAAPAEVLPAAVFHAWILTVGAGRDPSQEGGDELVGHPAPEAVVVPPPLVDEQVPQLDGGVGPQHVAGLLHGHAVT